MCWQIPYFQKQVFIASDFLYEQFKRIEKDEVTYGNLYFSLRQHLRENNIMLISENLDTIDKILEHCMSRLEKGLYDDNIVHRGIVNGVHSKFLDEFDAYMMYILKRDRLADYEKRELGEENLRLVLT